MQQSATKYRLLLVDGDPKSLRVLDVSLKKAGFQVITATNGLEALAALESIPDLIISDTHMPELDGFELCRRVKQRPQWAKIPFIFLSGRKSIEDKIRGLELGVEDYLSKPIYIKEIVTRVRMLLQRVQRERLESRRDSRTKFAGQLWDIGVVDLVQTIEINRKSGIIHIVNRDERRGSIYFRDGQVIDAEAGRLTGPQALYRMFSWGEGSFEVEFKAIRRKDTIELSPQALLMEGMRRLDEWTHLLESMPSLDTVFEVDYRLLAEKLADLPDEVNGLLRLFDGRRSLAQVIEDCDFPDLEALAIVSKLFADCLIRETQNEVSSGEDMRAPARLERWLSESARARPTEEVAPVWHPEEPTPEAPLVEEHQAAVPRHNPAPPAREPSPPPAPETRAPSGGDIIPFPAAASEPAAPMATPVSNHRDNSRSAAVAHAEPALTQQPQRSSSEARSNGMSSPAPAHVVAPAPTAETLDGGSPAPRERPTRSTVPGHALGNAEHASPNTTEARNPFDGPEDTLIVALAGMRRRRGLVMIAGVAAAVLLVAFIAARLSGAGRSARVATPPAPVARAQSPIVTPLPPTPSPTAQVPPPTVPAVELPASGNSAAAVAAAPAAAAGAAGAALAAAPSAIGAHVPAGAPSAVPARSAGGTPSPGGAPAAAAAAPSLAAAAEPVAAGAAPAASAGTPEIEALRADCTKAYAEGHGKYKSIATACQKLLDADPRATDAMTMMANAEYDRQHFKPARDWALKILEIDPSSSDAYAFIGTYEQIAGHRKEAKVAYERYLELAPTGRLAADLRAIVPTL